MAVLPLVVRPPLFSFCAFCRLVEPVLVGVALAPEPDAPFVGSAALPVGLMTEVMVMTCGGWPGAVADVMTTMDVSTAVEAGADGAVMVLVGGALADDCAGGADDWAGGGALDGGGGGADVGGSELGGGGGGADEAGGGSDDGAGALEGAGAGVEGAGLEAGSGAEGVLEAGGGLGCEFEAAAGASDEGCGDAAEGVTDGERGWEAGAEGEEGGLLEEGADEGAAAGLDATKEGDNVLAVTLLDMIAKIAQPGRQGTRSSGRTKGATGEAARRARPGNNGAK
jgi:hypothetical protein